MIKRIIISTLLLMLFIPNAAFANDGSFYSGKDNIDLKIIPSSFHANIGEDFTYTLEITNYTSDTLIMDSRYVDGNSDTKINPYKTVQFTITETLGKSTHWYKDGNKYFTTIQLMLDFNVEEDYFKYYTAETKPVTLEIDNIKDGSRFLSCEFLSYKEYITYQCREAWLNTGEYEYWGFIYNRMQITNISDIQIDNIYTNGSNSRLSLNPSEEKDIYVTFTDQTTLYNIPSRVNVQNQLLFELDGQYYGVTVSKNYPALYFDVPKIRLTIKGEKDENGYLKNQTIKLTNTSDDHIKNFYIDFNDYKPYLPDYIFPIIKAGETIEMDIPICYYTGIEGMYDYGYFVDGDDIIIGWIGGYMDGNATYTETDEYESITDYLGNNLLNYPRDFNYNHHEVEVAIILDTPTPPPYPTSRPSETPQPTVDNTSLPTDTPIISDTPLPAGSPTSVPAVTYTDVPDIAVVNQKEMPYIPTWVFIVLVFALCAIMVLFIYKHRQQVKSGSTNK